VPLRIAVAQWLAIAPALAPETDATAAPPLATTPAPESVPIEVPSLAFVAVEGLDAGALEAEITLRMPELRVSPLDGTSPTEPYLYIQARREAGKVHRIAIIFSDGRAFYEHLDVGDAGSPERVLASAIANLLFSIESGAVEPDQHGVETPLDERAAQPQPEPEPNPEAEPTPIEPELEPPNRDPALELGMTLGLGQATGLGAPRFADAHLGWFGALELSLRTRGGLFAALEFRPGGSSSDAYRLTRLHTGLGLGYAWRGPHVEFVIATTASVGAWLVSSEGRAEPVTHIDSGTVGRPPLLGFGLRLSPGYRVELQRGSLRALRVGPRIEAGGGFVTSSPPRVAGLQSRAGEELFRLGGVELYAGIELALWFTVTKPGPRP
jgi:hypothetical protein